MVKDGDVYALGYGEGTVGWMAARHVEHQGAFFAQHLKPGMSLLDCGCGPGTITCGLAKIVAPGPVTAIDIEPSQVEAAARLAESQKLDAVACQQASILDLPFDDNAFDAVFVSAVLGNLSKPEEAVKEIFRVLKPGGLAGVREFDHGGNMAHPMSPVLSRSINLYLSMRQQSGHAENYGRQVKGALGRVGFSDVVAKGVYETYASEDEVHAYADGILAIFEEIFGDKAIKLGLVDRASYEEMIEAWQDWAKDPAAFFATGWVEALARKPE